MTISIKKFRFLYEKYKSEETTVHNQNFIKFNYLNLSIHLSRDEREFNKSNFKLFSKLIHQKKINRTIFLKCNEEVSGYRKYLNQFKELNYLPNRKLPIVFLIDILKFGKQILDVFGIIIIVLFSIIFKFPSKYKNNKFILKNQKIYSIYYWNKKKSSSASYYYPNINSFNGDKAFISSFADSKLFCLGLTNSINNTDFLSPGKILNIQGLFISILQYIHLYLYDLYLPFHNKSFSFLSFWIGWRKAAEIFYSILIYNSLIELTKNSTNCEFISWHENQITNRAFALGVSKINRKSSTNNLISFNGSLFAQQIKSQFLPLNSELQIGFWGGKYFLQDEASLREMNSYLTKNKIYIPLEVAPRSMLRTKIILDDNFYDLQISREITIFTHSSYWDLIACLLSIFNIKNKHLIPKNLSKKNNKIFIRLHPALSKKRALEEIKLIKEIQNFNNFEFIDNNKESFMTSLSRCKYSFFGESSYVNLALENKSSVFAVETNHLNKPPIQLELINSQNLTVISPW